MEVAGIMLVMNINVREVRLPMRRSLVKMAASINATTNSNGTVSKK
jgi:hypothetical protein